MYQYTDFDKQFVRQRAAQFRDQLERNLAGKLGDDDFRPLRLQNGWYVQRHAPMLRVAVPYGELSSAPAAPPWPARLRVACPRPAATATSPRARTCSSTGFR
jgi:hypothetical protein